MVEEDVAVLRDGLGLALLLVGRAAAAGRLAAVVAEVRQLAALQEERVGHAHLLGGDSTLGSHQSVCPGDLTEVRFQNSEQQGLDLRELQQTSGKWRIIFG